jgi:hypothetical protein
MTTIIHWLELYLSIQLVPITIKVVCLTPASAQFYYETHVCEEVVSAFRRSMVFFGYSGFFTNKTCLHYIAKKITLNILKVALNALKKRNLFNMCR